MLKHVSGPRLNLQHQENKQLNKYITLTQLDITGKSTCQTKSYRENKLGMVVHVCNPTT